MNAALSSSRSRRRLGAALILLAAPSIALAQRGGPRTPRADSLREASRLDTEGSTPKARAILQRLIDGAPDPAAKAESQRALAMSYAFDGDGASAAKSEELVIAYWVTREQAEPQNAFYQEGELADEAARVCIDAGDLESAATWCRTGAALGLQEPGNETQPRSLWNFRREHALARIAARRGDKAEAQEHVAAAKAQLDGDPKMAGQQARFFPYLTGYVALYTDRKSTRLNSSHANISY